MGNEYRMRMAKEYRMRKRKDYRMRKRKEYSPLPPSNGGGGLEGGLRPRAPPHPELQFSYFLSVDNWSLQIEHKKTEVYR